MAGTNLETYGGADAASIYTLDQYMGYGTAFLNPDRFDLEIKENIQYFGPQGSPFVSWLQMVRRNPTSEISFSWQEDEYFTQRDIKARLYRTDSADEGTHTTYIYVLKLMSGGDWHAFEAAAKQDVWSAQGPLIYLTVMDAAEKRKHCAFTIRQNAITYGQATRDIISTTNDVSPNEITAYAAMTNGIVLVDEGPVAAEPAPGAALVGGVLGEVSLVDSAYLQDEINTTYNDATSTFFSGGAGLQTFGSTWSGAPAYVDVFVHITEPNEALKGFPQGSGLPTETRKKTRSRSNYVQIFKTPYSIANTLKAVKLRGGDELAILRKKKLVQHKTEIERAMMFQGGGVLDVDWGSIASTNENPLTRFKGIGLGVTTAANAGVIKTKNADLDDRFKFVYPTATQADFEDLVEGIFDDIVDSPSDTKIVFCSGKWLKVLAAKGLETHANASSYYGGGPVMGPREASPRNRLGLRVNEVETSAGILHFVRFPMFRGQWEDYAMVVDFAQCEYRPLRETTLVANAGDRTIDGQVDYYITEVGYEMRHESAHAILKLALS